MTDDFLSFSKDAAKTLGLSEAVLLETIKKITDSQNLDVLDLGVILNETMTDVRQIDEEQGRE